MPKALIVLGMHRSGTSAISGLLEQLGVFMGKKLFGPQRGVNEKGFFENAKVVALNEKLFDRLLQSWDDPYALNFKTYEISTLTDVQAEANQLLESEYLSHPLWGMKDPRTSLHIKFWQQVFKSHQVEPCYILMLRNPLEVAQSIHKRDQIETEHTLRLWLNYTLSSYLSCHDENLTIVKFDTLISNPKQVLRELTEVFSLDIDQDSVSFIDQELRHNKTDNKPTDQIALLALAVYEALSRPHIEHEEVVESAQAYFEKTQSENSLMRSHCRRLKQQEVYYRTHFLNAYESIWWKLTWPIRKLEIAIRGKKY